MHRQHAPEACHIVRQYKLAGGFPNQPRHRSVMTVGRIWKDVVRSAGVSASRKKARPTAVRHPINRCHGLMCGPVIFNCSSFVWRYERCVFQDMGPDIDHYEQ